MANRRDWRRRPDGVLVSGSHETAIQVETTANALDQYLAILDAYADQGVESHWYVVPTVAQERILHAAAVLDVGDLVTVWDWPPVAVRRDYATGALEQSDVEDALYAAAVANGLVADDGNRQLRRARWADAELTVPDGKPL